MVFTKSKQIITHQYREPFKLALAIQLPICIISLLALDLGVLAKICGCAMLGFWLGVSLICSRRPFAPKPSDLFFIRFGFVPIFVVALLIGELTMSLFGY